MRFVALFVFTSMLPEAWSDNSVGPFTFSYTLFIALPIGVLVVATFAVVVDQLVYRTMRRRGALPGVMALASLGVAIALRGFIQYIWGTEVEHFPSVSKKFFIWTVDFLHLQDVQVRVPPDMIFVAISRDCADFGDVPVPQHDTLGEGDARGSGQRGSGASYRYRR